jgi:hypothetical protein
MLRLRRWHSLEKFAAVRSPVCNRVSSDRRYSGRDAFKAARAAALAERRRLSADRDGALP